MRFLPFHTNLSRYWQVDDRLDDASQESLFSSMANKTSLDELDPQVCPDSRIQKRKCNHLKLLVWLNILIFCLVSVMLSIAVRVSFHANNMGMNTLARQVSEHSPIFDDLEISLSSVKMNATVVETNPPSIYRQKPSREVDAAWKRLANVRPIPLTRDDVIKVGKDPERAAKWPESFGFGPDTYIGRIDVFHQIHCLDTLRREAYFDHYYGKKWPHGTPTSDLHQTHLSHCIHLLLQNLMCSANVDIYTHFWADAQYNAFPDFSLNHKCRDFEAILNWQEDNSVDIKEFDAIRRPADYPPRVMTHRFKELFGWFNDHEDDGSAGVEIA